MTTPATGGPRRVRVSGDLFHGRVPPDAVYVGRAAPGLPASRHANPHTVDGTCRRCGQPHDRAQAVAAYARDLPAGLVAAARHQLAGADLACWCPPDQPCHADVLLRLANPDPATAQEPGGGRRG